ncbi:MAG: NgoFVII family restriction endonuclease, partial [Ignavibacteriales bacterium]|nr:NgoFVII family restriction endonuclease [Ignavibacteriales bacterium]
MPKIFDNINLHLKTGLLETLEGSYRADFCVGYFNLRGWRLLMNQIDNFEGQDNCCRLLIGMQMPDEDQLRKALSESATGLMDNPTANILKKEVARSFAKQLTFGMPTDDDENALRKLKFQISQSKLKVRLFLAYPLHAKLYLCHKNDNDAPLIGYVGSSNLTMAGLAKQGELNVNIVEQDAAEKLDKWFEERWNDRWCVEVSDELIQIIENSWAGEKSILPYYIYLKIAYHLSQEARSGIGNYIIPKVLKTDLLPFQMNAVSVAARHLDKRGGVLISDVVGLGKTMTATAVAKLFEETFFTETLIICPKNLVEMWEGYVHNYQLRAKVQSSSKIDWNFLEKTRRYRVVIIDESHNLRNREAKRYAILKDYLDTNESKVILLTATPYNKSYTDISNQLRLFIPEDKDIGISPDNLIKQVGGVVEFIAKYQYMPSTLLAFEKSEFAEDWQELLKHYMIRRTRTFIKENYAGFDTEKKQHFITFNDDRIEYFPDRIPKKVEYSFNPKDEKDIYVKLYDDDTVNTINSLYLARYGLGNYINKQAEVSATEAERKIITNLSRAGKRLMGFCRTNLYKRLESSGFSFLISLARHVLRNEVFIYAIESGLPFPIGQQEKAEMDEFLEENDNDDNEELKILTEKSEYKRLGKKFYEKCAVEKNRFDWISADLFTKELRTQIESDNEQILTILETGKNWNSDNDKKLDALEELCRKTHSVEKILIFTQFADTALYLFDKLQKRGVRNIACATGDAENPSELAKRFSPVSNKCANINDEIHVLISTDVLSEGQNLQDAHIIVNFDLPWAIIRLIQRAGRVDRIGQTSDKILCYSFLPHDGLDQIIRLRSRLRKRIKENAEAVGADEVFFDGDPVNINDLYSEKAGILDDDEDDVDLTSQAYEIWNKAVRSNPALKNRVIQLADVVYSTKEKTDEIFPAEGVITYHRNRQGFELLSLINDEGNIISTSQTKILKIAECSPDTPAREKLPDHHKLVKKTVQNAEKEASGTGGQLGNKSNARYKAYGMLTRYYESVKSTLFDVDALKKTIDDIYHYPLREPARELINRRIKFGCTDDEMASLCMQLR